MGAIKDLVDLCTKLDESIKDRKIRDLFLPIKEKTLDVRTEFVELSENHAAEREVLRKKHEQEIAKLKAELQAKDEELAALSPKTVTAFSQETGTYYDDANGLHYCPKCWIGTPRRESPTPHTGNSLMEEDECHRGTPDSRTRRARQSAAERVPK